MVSLINFKTFDEDLNESQVRDARQVAGEGRGSRPLADRLHEHQSNFSQQQAKPAGLQAHATDAAHKKQQQQQRRRHDMNPNAKESGSNTSSRLPLETAGHQDASQAAVPSPALCCTGYEYYCNNNNNKSTDDNNKLQVASGAGAAAAEVPGQNYPSMNAPHNAPPSKAACRNAASFTVTWRKLKFCIEPKWHERLASGSAALLALASRATPQPSPSSCSSSSSLAQSSTLPATKTTSKSECAQTGAQQTPAPTTTRVVLDQLDGSFKSGELTAILGPSGAGKTTLLDCLTGHRKSGLSGSVRFSVTSSSSSSSSLEVMAPCDADDRQSLASYMHGPHANAETQNKQRNLMLAQAGRFSSKQPAIQLDHGLLNSAPDRKSPGASTPGDELMNGDNLKVSIIPQNDHLIGHLTVYETLNYASKMKNCFEGQFDHKLNVRRVAQQLGLMSCLGTRINKLSGGQYKRVSIAQELLSSPDVLILDEPTSGLDAMSCYQTVQVLKKLTDDCKTNGQKSIAVILTIHQPNSDVFQQFNHVYVVAQGGKCIYEGPPGNIESVINRVGICLPNSYYNPATMIVEIAAGKFGQAAISKLNQIQRKQYSTSVALVDEQNSTGDSAVDCPSSNYDEDEDELPPSPLPPQNDQQQINAGKINAGFTMDGELELEKDTNNNNNNNQDQIKASDNCCVPFGVVANDKSIACSCDPTSGQLALELHDAGSGRQLDSPTNVAGCEKQDRRKKRRRTRRRASEMTANNADSRGASPKLRAPAQARSETPTAVRILMGGGGGGGDGDSGDGNGSDAGGGQAGRAEKRLKLNSLKADQKFPFWRHTYLHFHRSWLSIVRDPMLCSMQLALHIIVPVMVSLVYGTYVGKPNACPRAGPIDIMAYAMEPTDTALQLQEDLRTTLENIGYIFFKLYGIIFAAMTVTVLTFPLDMHVLVKEFRNGWYGLASYFLGRTLADIPFQLTLPLLAMSLSYYATGQPSSYLQWRFFSITAILILSSLIAQSQGLLFGAILMDKMKAAVFVAPAATTPIILFAGFLVRTQSIPSYLRPLSNLSYLRYAIEACLISRYGFNQCECDPSIFNQTVRELPPIARSMLDYWLSSYRPNGDGTNETALQLETGDDSLGQQAATNKPDLFTKLTDSLARANSFGRNITSCEQVVPYPMIDYDLKDEQLFSCFAILLAMLIFTRLLTFFIVCFKVKRKV